jgi:hypothetical protein
MVWSLTARMSDGVDDRWCRQHAVAGRGACHRFDCTLDCHAKWLTRQEPKQT